jgi:hypothetical protein
MATITLTAAGNSDIITQAYQKIRVTGAGNSNQLAEDVKPLLHISGSQGLVYDAAGGALTNGRGAAYIVNCFGDVELVLAGEIRFKDRRRIYNRIALSEVINGSVEGTAPTRVDDYELSPTGTLTADRITFGAGDSRLVKYNVSFSQGRTYNESIYARSVSTSLNKFCITALDTSAFFVPMSNIAASTGWKRVKQYGTSTKTVTTGQIILKNASDNLANDIVLWGWQFTDTTRLINPNPDEYVSAGVLSAPYHGAGVDRVKYVNYKPQPYGRIAIYGDSISVQQHGSSSPFWTRFFFDAYGDCTNYGVGGETTPQQLARITTNHLDTDIVIIESGHNSWDQPLATVMGWIAEMVAFIPHNKFVVCTVTRNSPSTLYGIPNPAQNAACDAISQAIRITYPENCADIATKLYDAYDRNDPTEVALAEQGFVSERLQYDGIHPSLVGDEIITQEINRVLTNLGIYDQVPLAGVPAIIHEGATSNLALLPRDLTNAAWVKTDCTAAKTATGTDFTVNSASTLTATAANATCLQTITSGSANRVTGAFIKRRTGTGVVNMTQDNGATWTPVTVPAAWGAAPIVIPAATLANPVIGFQIVTSGDAIDVDWVQHELGSYITSPISGTRTIDSIKVPASAAVNFRQDKQITFIRLKMNFASSAGNKAIFAANTGATDFIYDNGSGGIALSDGTNTATAAVGGWAAGDTLLIAECHDSAAGSMSVHVSKNGGAWVDSTDTTYDGAFSVGANLLLASANTDSIEFNHISAHTTKKYFANMQKWAKANAAIKAF